MRGDVGRGLDVALRGAPAERGAEVRELGRHPVDRVAEPGSVPLVPPRGHLAREVGGVPIARAVEVAELGQLVLGELTDRLEEAVPDRARDPAGDDERLAHE